MKLKISLVFNVLHVSSSVIESNVLQGKPSERVSSGETEGRPIKSNFTFLLDEVTPSFSITQTAKGYRSA